MSELIEGERSSLKVSNYLWIEPDKLSVLHFVLLLLFSTLFSSCNQQSSTTNLQFDRELQVADSLFLAAKPAKADSVLQKLRSKIQDDDPFIAKFYNYETTLNELHSSKMNDYADSALSFFNTNHRIEVYPDEYRQALLNKGYASTRINKYVNALRFYEKAGSVRHTNKCDNGDLAQKIGAVYYDQGNYRLAAGFSAQNYRKFLKCPGNISREKRIMTLQAILNNTGYAYERAGMLDSAKYYYQLDIELIDNAERSGEATRHNINLSRAVVYDNLGGLYLKLGKLEVARQYLVQSTTLIPDGADATKVTALIKLAKVYLELKQTKQAGEALDHAYKLLKRYDAINSDFRVRWLKTYADYLFQMKQPADAFLYQRRFIRAKDSLADSKSELYRLDISREIRTLQRQGERAKLHQQERYQKLYLISIALGAVLSIVIIYLVVRNLRRSQQAQREAVRRSEQLQSTNAELELANHNHIRMMRVMAHDLRNPLGGIGGLAQVLLDDLKLTEEERHMLSLIHTSSVHSLKMINDLLTSGFGDKGPLEKQLIDINVLLFESVELLEFRAIEKDQHINYSGPGKPIFIQLNYEDIWRVMNNLIVNALKFSHKGKIVDVTLETGTDHVLVSIADRGIGIPEKNKETVFEMFTSAKRFGTDGEQPFGLGLSISKNIIDRHGGQIWFEDRPEGGTIFFLKLPF